MTPALLAKIKDLVEAGATVVGGRGPVAGSVRASPALRPAMERSSAELWGDCDGSANSGEHRFGARQGQFGARQPKECWPKMGVRARFRVQIVCLAQSAIFTLDGGHADVYFVATSAPRTLVAHCTFRVCRQASGSSGIPIRAKSSLSPSFTGRRTKARNFRSGLGPSGLVFFVVFQPDADVRWPIAWKVLGDGRPVLAAGDEGGHESRRQENLDPPRGLMASRPARLKAATLRLRFADWWIVGSRASGLNMRCLERAGFMKTLTVDYTIDGCPRKTARTDRELMLLSPDTEPRRRTSIAVLTAGSGSRPVPPGATS